MTTTDDNEQEKAEDSLEEDVEISDKIRCRGRSKFIGFGTGMGDTEQDAIDEAEDNADDDSRARADAFASTRLACTDPSVCRAIREEPAVAKSTGTPVWDRHEKQYVCSSAIGYYYDFKCVVEV
jgi:hypothetical protein